MARYTAKGQNLGAILKVATAASTIAGASISSSMLPASQRLGAQQRAQLPLLPGGKGVRLPHIAIHAGRSPLQHSHSPLLRTNSSSVGSLPAAQSNQDSLHPACATCACPPGCPGFRCGCARRRVSSGGMKSGPRRSRGWGRAASPGAAAPCHRMTGTAGAPANDLLPSSRS